MKLVAFCFIIERAKTHYFIEQCVELQAHGAIAFLARKLITTPSCVSFFDMQGHQRFIYFVLGTIRHFYA